MEARALPGVSLEATPGGGWTININEARFNITAYRDLAYR
jgi:hypothetical protein